MSKPTAHEVLQRLAAAAAPYGLRAERTAFSPLPDLVLLRPSDNRPVARLRFLEPEHGSPHLRTVYPPEVSPAEEAEIDAHLGRRLVDVIGEVFSYTVWLALPDVAGTPVGMRPPGEEGKSDRGRSNPR